MSMGFGAKKRSGLDDTPLRVPRLQNTNNLDIYILLIKLHEYNIHT